MKTFSLLNFLLLAQISIAQIFTEIQNIPFEDIVLSKFEFADVDGDEYPDLFITGRNENFEHIAKLYTNDGTGNYAEVMDTPFEAVDNNNFKFGDVDNDDDLDLLITGSYIEYPYNNIAKLYKNDGKGNFTYFKNDSLGRFDYSSIDFADVDRDGDIDLLLMGERDIFPIRYVSALYLNDGNGSFTEKKDVSLNSVQGEASFIDFDNDNNPDILIYGFNREELNYLTTVYLNDGKGNFNKLENLPFESVISIGQPNITYIDIDNDEDEDIIRYYNGDHTLFLNNGNGNFTDSRVIFQYTVERFLWYLDIDGDGDPDVFVTEQNLMDTDIKETKYYENDGQGNFNLTNIDSFNDIWVTDIEYSDINNDGSIDILLIDKKNTEFPVFRLFVNEQSMTSINEEIDNEKPHLYLNNFNVNGKVQIIYHTLKNKEIQVSIFDANGIHISTFNTSIINGVNQINLNDDLNRGLYFIQIVDNDKTSCLKWLINK